jgi:hypothetical protein
MTERVILSGTCHCGAIRGTLAATKPAAELQVRACQCGFCTRHGAMTVSDPAGKATFEIERAALTRAQCARPCRSRVQGSQGGGGCV